jgi:hypothetical protein
VQCRAAGAGDDLGLVEVVRGAVVENLRAAPPIRVEALLLRLRFCAITG